VRDQYTYSECRSVLGSELHYQAMIYHCLRNSGVPNTQLGMNVKMYVENCRTELFKSLDMRKHEEYRGGFEPIPDVVLFSPSVSADWRRRNNETTLDSMLIAIEVKASERHKGRLSFGEIGRDIDKLAAHREEVNYKDSDFLPVMLIVDTAEDVRERMTEASLGRCKAYSEEMNVPLMYFSETIVYSNL